MSVEVLRHTNIIPSPTEFLFDDLENLLLIELLGQTLDSS